MDDQRNLSPSTITFPRPSPQTPISQLSPSQAASLLLHRRTIRASLQAWCTEALEPFGHAPAGHHLAIIERLEALTRGDIERLIILAPPGSAKSTYVSQLFPAWYLAQNPAAAIITASHTAELADRFGRRVRNLVNEHAATLGYELSADNQAAGRWETTAGGEYYAIGVLGGVTGRRADLAIIDDPVKSRAEADSETVRDRVWEWWQSDVQTRLKPGAKVVLIMTRWHEDDLGGRLLNDMTAGGRAWEILRLPMEAEQDDPLGRMPGELLWPEWFTEAMRTDAKRDTRTWSALYQQRPVPATGDYFQADWLRPALSLPRREDMRVYGASDYAVTAGGGDWTVHVVVGMDPAGQLWLLDLWRGQTPSDVWIDGLHYLTSAPWRADLEAELLSFPAGRHDDQVDALGLAGQLLDIMTPGQKREPEKPARRDSWDIAFERAERDGYGEANSWRTA